MDWLKIGVEFGGILLAIYVGFVKFRTIVNNKLDTMHEDIGEIKDAVRLQNGRVRNTEIDVSRLQEFRDFQEEFNREANRKMAKLRRSEVR